jgi:hypothetical protein
MKPKIDPKIEEIRIVTTPAGRNDYGFFWIGFLSCF